MFAGSRRCLGTLLKWDTERRHGRAGRLSRLRFRSTFLASVHNDAPDSTINIAVPSAQHLSIESEMSQSFGMWSFDLRWNYRKPNVACLIRTELKASQRNSIQNFKLKANSAIDIFQLSLLLG
jgi:hypothetical protein